MYYGKTTHPHGRCSSARSAVESFPGLCRYGSALAAAALCQCAIACLPLSVPAATDTPPIHESRHDRLNKTSPTPTPDTLPVRALSAERDETLNQLLAARPSGWLGSDVIHSVPIGGKKTFWIFGDTLLGTLENGARRVTHFINNSIAIQDTTTTPPLGMTFHWGPDNTSFFPHQPGTPGTYYWPTAAIYLDGEIFIFCYSVSPAIGGFSLDGTTMIRVSNPDDPPSRWSWKAQDFGFGGADKRTIHAAVYVEGDTVYFLGNEPAAWGKTVTILARMTKAKLLAGGLADQLEFWSRAYGGPAWCPSSGAFQPLFSSSVSETEIQFVPALGRYFTTLYNGFSPTISLVTSTSLTGPWSESIPVYDVPEHEQVAFPILSYAARLHPDLATDPRELILSYATNALGSIDPLSTPEGLIIYQPRFVRVRLGEPADP